MPTRLSNLLVAISLLLLALSRVDAAPLRVFLRASPEIYGPGIHDHPRFLADWTALLRERGADVAGGLAFPTAAELARTDVLVLHAYEGASIHGDERTRFEAYLARGGGLVVVHDAIAGDDPHWFKTVAGGAWEHHQSKEHTGLVGLYVRDREHAITAGVQNFDLDDEIYFGLHMMPEARVLMSGFHSVFAITPQMWTYETDRHRAFVTLQGHRAGTFAHAAFRTLLLRGIAWAGRRDVNLLTKPPEVAGLRYPEGGPRSPEAAAASIEVHPDFDLSLAAAEPLVVNPISIDWDAQGRMWVALTPGYPHKQASSGIAAHDRIVILNDRDGDGRMDESKVFADGLDLVTSFVFHRDGVIVSAAPEVLWLRDTDRDDVADQRVVLYSGFGFADTHATLSNLRWGLDGFIYAAQGYSGQGSLHVVGERDFGPIPGGLLRFRPDGSAIGSLLTASSNVWGLDFDWDGEAFYSLANGAHARHVVTWDSTLASGRIDDVEGFADIADHAEVVPIRVEDREPYRQIDFVGGFTAAAGDVIYDGGVWPEEYRSNHFVCEPTVNLVHRDVIRADGVSYRATKSRRSEFLASTDLWFRPVHLRVGPDGALYVLDFYNQAVVHDDARGPAKGPTNAAVRPDRDDLHGRVWRVQHKRAPPSRGATLDGASDATLVAALGEGAGARRRTAARLLRERGAAGAGGLAAALTAASPAARVSALWLLHDQGALAADALAVALSDDDPGVRKNAWQLAGLVGAPMVDAAHAALAREKHPRVRVVALAAMGQVLAATEVGARGLLALAPALDDAWSRSALLHAFAKDPARLLAAAFARPAGEPWLGWVVGAAELVARGRDRDTLTRMMAAASATGAEPRLVVPALTRLIGFWPAEEIPTPLPELEPAVTRLLASGHASVLRATLPIASRVAASGVAATVARQVEKERTTLLRPGPAESRIAALRVLLALPEERPRAIRDAALLLARDQSLETQGAVIGILADSADAGVAETVTAAFPGLAASAREVAFQVLGQRPAWMLRFLSAVRAGAVSDADLGLDRRSRLLEHPDPAVRRRAREVLSGAAAGGTDLEAVIAELSPVVDAPGDAANGKKVFTENCASCHRVLGEGASFGPDLTGMGVGGASSLLSSVIDPNRAVDPSYQLYVARTGDGRTLTGILARDTPDRVVLREPGGDTSLRRGEIASLEPSGRSPMPTGFEILGGTALRDLLAYLRRGYEDFRILDLEPLCTASTWYGLYDVKRSPTHMDFTRYGAIDIGGVPFEVLDPVRTASGLNAIVLKGGDVFDSDAKLRMPQRVSIPVGFAVRRVHVLGGIAGWGYPFRDTREPAVRWTWQYQDGSREEVVLGDGREFADWIRRVDVPGSRYAAGLLRPSSPGQVRRFSLTPGRRDVAVKSIILESYDNHLAPTFLGLTAQPASEALTPALVAELDTIRRALADASGRAGALVMARELLATAEGVDGQIAIVDELGSAGDAELAEILIDAFPKLRPPARERAVQALLDDFESSERLLNAIASGRIAAADLAPGQDKRLESHAEPVVAARAAAVFARARAMSGETRAALEQVAVALGQASDAGRGRAVFRRECARCHDFVSGGRGPLGTAARILRHARGESRKLGPDLSGVGARDPLAVARVLLDPDRAIDRGYELHQARLTDGAAVTGVIVSETATRVVLRDETGDHDLDRTRLGSLRPLGRSSMPQSFATLDARGTRDLLAFFARGYGGYRLVDITPAATASTTAGLYDPERSKERPRFRRRGVVRVGAVPFLIVDPDRSPSQFDAIVLKGGMEADWDSKRKRPRRVELALGYPLRRMHVLGGIAAWGYPFTDKREALVRWTFVYRDGVREDHELRDGHEFADFIRRVDVPGSTYVKGILDKGSVGQVRRFTVTPKRPDAIVEALVLESTDSYAAPTFLALTAEVGEVDGVPVLPWLATAALVVIAVYAGRVLRRSRRRRFGAGAKVR